MLLRFVSLVLTFNYIGASHIFNDSLPVHIIMSVWPHMHIGSLKKRREQYLKRGMNHRWLAYCCQRDSLSSVTGIIVIFPCRELRSVQPVHLDL